MAFEIFSGSILDAGGILRQLLEQSAPVNPSQIQDTKASGIPTQSGNVPQPSGNAGGLPQKKSAQGQTQDDFQAFADAIIQQESGGNYQAVSDAGALGAYQIMPDNIASWSKDALGFEITPEQFLASPHFQDIIALHKLRSYYDQYGARGAAAAWYSGDASQANNYDSQSGGPSVGAYADQIVQGMGNPSTPVGVAGGGGQGGGVSGSYQVDGHTIVPGTEEDMLYQMANSVWRGTYMQNAPYSLIDTMRNSGIHTKAQLETLVNEMPGPWGYTIGQYDSTKQAAQKASDKYFGRPVPDTLIKQLLDQGMSPGEVDSWVSHHSANDIGKDNYQAIFDAALPYTHGVYGTVPSPDQISHFHAQYQKRQQSSYTPAEQVRAAVVEGSKQREATGGGGFTA